MNPEKQNLMKELKKTSHTESAGLWKRVAKDLEKSSRNNRVVNLSRINRYTQADETVIVPGKVLGAGTLDHKVHVAAFSFSRAAKDMITKLNGTAITIPELVKQNPKAKNVKIIG
jgi:large subunit ribosomal protein L18e